MSPPRCCPTAPRPWRPLVLPSSARSSADPVALGQMATGLLDVLPVMQHTTAEYAYLRQSVRTNNAAVVADGAVNPPASTP